MALDTGIYQPLRFYKRLKDQNHRRRWSAGDLRSFPLITSKQRFIPFQIRRETLNIGVNSIKIYNAETDAFVSDILANLTSEIEIKRFEGFDQIIYYGNDELSSELQEGKFYIVLNAGVDWFSEVFTVIDLNESDLSANHCNFLKITWSNSCDIANFYYSNPDQDYSNKIILSADLAPAEYPTQIEGSEDGESVFFPDFMRVAKEWRFEVFVPEFVVDLIAVISIHDRIFISTYEGYTARMQNFAFAPDSNIINGFRKVEVSFTVDFFLAVGCCGEVLTPLEGCYIANQTVLAFLEEGSPDHTGFTYQDNEGATVPMEDGDIFMIKYADETFGKQLFNGFIMVDLPEILYGTETLSTENGDYYFHVISFMGSFVWFDGPIIEAVPNSPLRVIGQSFENAGVELWLRGSVAPAILYTFATNEEFETVGIPFDDSFGTYNQLKIKATGIDCILGETDWADFSTGLSGIPNLQIGGNFQVSPG